MLFCTFAWSKLLTRWTTHTHAHTHPCSSSIFMSHRSDVLSLSLPDRLCRRCDLWITGSRFQRFDHTPFTPPLLEYDSPVGLG